MVPQSSADELANIINKKRSIDDMRIRRKKRNNCCTQSESCEGPEEKGKN